MYAGTVIVPSDHLALLVHVCYFVEYDFAMMRCKDAFVPSKKQRVDYV